MAGTGDSVTAVFAVAVTASSAVTVSLADAGAAVAARWQQVITGNVQRMARRFAAGQLVSAEVLADALAISEEKAKNWLATTMRGDNEENYSAALAELALKDES